MNEKLKVLDLFSGIGGFSLGLERTGGFETVAFCEIEEFPQKVLRKHWPDVPIFNDAKELTGEQVGTIDVITGGFPCQDISTAGKQRGIKEGTRSGLWSEIIRLAGETRPRYIIVENVANLLSGPSEQRGGWFGRVLGDLAECGYNAEWENIPAAAVGASHRRERVWIVAYNTQDGNKELCFPHSREDGAGEKGAGELNELSSVLRRARSFIRSFPGEPSVGRMVHGVSRQMDRLGALGNAVVPQIPEIIGMAILEAEKTSLSRDIGDQTDG